MIGKYCGCGRFNNESKIFGSMLKRKYHTTSLLKCKITLDLEDTKCELYIRREEVIFLECVTRGLILTVYRLDMIGVTSSCPRPETILNELKGGHPMSYACHLKSRLKEPNVVLPHLSYVQKIFGLFLGRCIVKQNLITLTIHYIQLWDLGLTREVDLYHFALFEVPKSLRSRQALINIVMWSTDFE